MGATFSQVYVNFQDSQAVEALLEQLAEDPQYAGSISMTDVDEERSGWTLVIDGGNPGDPVIPRELSARLDCTAVSVWVFDSDVWGYLLFDRGALIDEHVSDPDYIAGMDGRDMSEIPVGRPESVASYISGGVDSARKFLALRPDFAEDALEQFVQVLLDGPGKA